MAAQPNIFLRLFKRYAPSLFTAGAMFFGVSTAEAAQHASSPPSAPITTDFGRAGIDLVKAGGVGVVITDARTGAKQYIQFAKEILTPGFLDRWLDNYLAAPNGTKSAPHAAPHKTTIRNATAKTAPQPYTSPVSLGFSPLYTPQALDGSVPTPQLNDSGALSPTPAMTIPLSAAELTASGTVSSPSAVTAPIAVPQITASGAVLSTPAATASVTLDGTNGLLKKIADQQNEITTLENQPASNATFAELLAAAIAGAAATLLAVTGFLASTRREKPLRQTPVEGPYKNVPPLVPQPRPAPAPAPAPEPTVTAGPAFAPADATVEEEPAKTRLAPVPNIILAALDARVTRPAAPQSESIAAPASEPEVAPQSMDTTTPMFAVNKSADPAPTTGNNNPANAPSSENTASSTQLSPVGQAARNADIARAIQLAAADVGLALPQDLSQNNNKGFAIVTNGTGAADIVILDNRVIFRHKNDAAAIKFAAAYIANLESLGADLMGLRASGLSAGGQFHLGNRIIIARQQKNATAQRQPLPAAQPAPDTQEPVKTRLAKMREFRHQRLAEISRAQRETNNPPTIKPGAAQLPAPIVQPETVAEKQPAPLARIMNGFRALASAFGRPRGNAATQTAAETPVLPQMTGLPQTQVPAWFERTFTPEMNEVNVTIDLSQMKSLVSPAALTPEKQAMPLQKDPATALAKAAKRAKERLLRDEREKTPAAERQQSAITAVATVENIMIPVVPQAGNIIRLPGQSSRAFLFARKTAGAEAAASRRGDPNVIMGFYLENMKRYAFEAIRDEARNIIGGKLYLRSANMSGTPALIISPESLTINATDNSDVVNDGLKLGATLFDGKLPAIEVASEQANALAARLRDLADKGHLIERSHQKAQFKAGDITFGGKSLVEILDSSAPQRESSRPLTTPSQQQATALKTLAAE